MLITKLRTFQTTNILDTPKLSIVLSFLNSRSIWHLDTSKSVLWHLYKYGIKGEPKVHLTLFASRQMVVFVWHIAHGLLSIDLCTSNISSFALFTFCDCVLQYSQSHCTVCNPTIILRIHKPIFCITTTCMLF